MSDNKIFIDKVKSWANAKFPDSEIYLFGSRAKNIQNKDSDWDLLVLLESEKIGLETEIQVMDDFFELELETGQVISPLIYSKEEWKNGKAYKPLFQNIVKEGVRLK
jgi:uncharacterized protein